MTMRTRGPMRNVVGTRRGPEENVPPRAMRQRAMPTERCVQTTGGRLRKGMTTAERHAVGVS